ncbi:hypothetical protein FA95DRAFT_1122463 [Auriscalpium vulgare]|uniref:Uncharacterized protein n=1 Tax=Auriscalpium vulgare TaxID=40419 RepID=A0ACB8R495_9AGAM|nr:hypothetical protein FA95DRAFT_1122463 [Auriscalpium vulgare]
MRSCELRRCPSRRMPTRPCLPSRIPVRSSPSRRTTTRGRSTFALRRRRLTRSVRRSRHPCALDGSVVNAERSFGLLWGLCVEISCRSINVYNIPRACQMPHRAVLAATPGGATSHNSILVHNCDGKARAKMATFRGPPRPTVAPYRLRAAPAETPSACPGVGRTTSACPPTCSVRS